MSADITPIRRSLDGLRLTSAYEDVLSRNDRDGDDRLSEYLQDMRRSHMLMDEVEQQSRVLRAIVDVEQRESSAHLHWFLNAHRGMLEESYAPVELSIRYERKARSASFETEPIDVIRPSYIYSALERGNLALSDGHGLTLLKAQAEHRLATRALSLAYRMVWLVLGLVALVWGALAGLSFFAGVGLDHTSIVFGAFALLGLMATAFVAGHNADEDE